LARAADFFFIFAMNAIKPFEDASVSAQKWETTLQDRVGSNAVNAKAVFLCDLGWPTEGTPGASVSAATSFLQATRCGKTHRGAYEGLWWYEGFSNPSRASVDNSSAHLGLYTDEGESKGLDWSSCRS
jgi:exo-beta-1,3-glucanase (GH17 family)